MRKINRRNICKRLGLLRVVALALITVIVIGTIPVTAASKKVTVTNKTKLLVELKKSGAKTIVFSSKTKKTITIPAISGTEKKTLVIDAKNAKIVNKSGFKGITLKNCGTFTEKGKGNKITLTGDNIKIIVAKKAKVAKLTLSGKSADVTVQQNSVISSVECNKKSGKYTLNVADKAKVSANLIKKSSLNITGSKKADIDVEISAKGSTVTAEAPVNVNANADATLNLKKGSEGSEVVSTSKVNAKINNTSTKEPTVKVDGNVVSSGVSEKADGTEKKDNTDKTTGSTNTGSGNDNGSNTDTNTNSNNSSNSGSIGNIVNTGTANADTGNAGNAATGNTDSSSVGNGVGISAGTETPGENGTGTTNGSNAGASSSTGTNSGSNAGTSGGTGTNSGSSAGTSGGTENNSGSSEGASSGTGTPTPVPTPIPNNGSGNGEGGTDSNGSGNSGNNGSNITPTPTEKVTNTPTPTEKATDTLTPTEKATDMPTPTEKVTDTPTPTEKATDTPTPTEKATDTPTPTEKVTDKPTPTEVVTNTPTPTEAIGRPYTTKILVEFNQAEARTMLNKINEIRAAENDEDVEPLVIDYDLEKVAMQRAAELAIRFGNTRPDGKSSEQTLVEYGFDPNEALFAEMFCMGDNNTVDLDAAFDYFASTSRYRISLTGFYCTVGIGHVKIDETDFWVINLSTAVQNIDNDNNIDGKVYFPLNIPETSVTSVALEYVSGAQTVKVGETVTAPIYIPKVRFSGSEMDAVYLEPIAFWSEDEFIKASNGTITGKKAGTGTISGKILEKTYSVNIDVTE